MQPAVLNSLIRAKIPQPIKANGGSMDSRLLIAQLAAKYKTSKQRICGNISFLCQTHIIEVSLRNPPHSLLA
jgi:hypothetical protein